MSHMNGFKLVLIWLVVLGALSGSLAYGDSILTLTLNPLSGALSAAPGQTTGWGFTLTNTSDQFAVITSADFCGAVLTSPCSTPLGVFTDFIAQFNFSAVNAHSSLSAVFNPLLRTGIGSYRINNGTLSGSSFLGQVVLTYDTFTDGTFNNQTGSDIRLSAPASVSVNAAAAPEPSSGLLLFFGVALLLVRVIACGDCRRGL